MSGFKSQDNLVCYTDAQNRKIDELNKIFENNKEVWVTIDGTNERLKADAQKEYLEKLQKILNEK